MKFAIGLMTLLVASGSFAQKSNMMLKAQGQIQEYPTNQDQEGVNWAPIYRRSKVKVTISKSKFIHTGDKFDNVTEKVCTKESEIKVWDLRQPSDGYTIPLNISCDTQIDGVNLRASVGINAQVSIVDIHLDSNKIPMLGFWGILLLDKTGIAATSGSFSKDLDLKSSFISLGQTQIISCKNPNDPNECTADHPEILNASVEYIGE